MPLGPLNDRQRGWGRWWTAARSLTLSSFGMATLIGFNLAQTASLALIPFSRSAFRGFNRWCANTWWGWCVITAERLNRTRLVISGAEVPERENAIVVSNHQQMPDITAIMAFARSKHRLGDLKFFVKKAIKWVPGIGWGMQFLDCVFVHRDWTADRDSVRRAFSRIVDQRIPLWLVSFVEGTRVTPEKIQRSREYAERHGLVATNHVLLPRTKGFVASILGLGDHVNAVYDLTIGYVDGVPTLWQYIKGSVDRVHIHVRRFPIAALPTAEESLSQWLHDRFVEKDRLLEHFYTHGAFPDETAPVEPTAA